MSDWFAASLRLQRQMLDTQRATLAAGQRAVAAGDAAVRWQAAGRKAVEANLAIYDAWASLWRIGR